MPPVRVFDKHQSDSIVFGGNDIKNVHTELFVKWMKRKRLLRAVKGILREKFHTVPFFGPQLADNTCEILLKPCQKSSSGAKFAESKDYLQYILKVIKESVSKVTDKEPDVIDLEESDNECTNKELTVVDKSIEIIDLDRMNQMDRSGKFEQNTNGNVDLDDSDVIILDVVNNSNNESMSKLCTGSVLKETNQQRNKRKHNGNEKDCDKAQVVEILDDSVIVLDDSLHVPTSTICKNRSPEIKDTFLQNSINRVSIDHPLKIVSYWSEAKTVSKISSSITNDNRDDSRNNNGISNPVLLSSPPRVSPNSASAYYPNTDTNTHKFHNSETERIISSPPKKKSKLTYKRPAHLVTPLVQPAQPASASTSCDSVSNIFSLSTSTSQKRSGLRPIVIDGNNVAISHGKGSFSLKGIQICIKYFERRGHEQIKVFLPSYRMNRDNNEELNKMERQGIIVLTPSRKVQGRILSSYDDRYIVQYATEVGGVIISKDNFRDLLSENPDWKETIEKRLLMFTWVDDLLMFPVDPLGRNGPSLDEFLRFPDT